MRMAIIFSALAAFGGFLFGYDIGYISGCLIMPDFVQQFGQPDGSGSYVLSSQRQAIITSLLSAGTFFGAFFQTFTSDSLGRRGSIIFWSSIFEIGVIIQVSSFALAQLVVGRCVAGLGVGAMSAIVPLYVGEAAPKRLRGSLLVLYQVQIIFGLFIAYIVNLGTHHYESDASWRVPIGIQLAWGLILLGGAAVLPESPRLLLGKNKEKEAIKAIAKLNEAQPDDAIVAEVMAEMEDAIRQENEGGKATWLECFSTRSMMWKRTMNGMMVQFLQQLNGQNFYYYYAPVFFEAANTDLSPFAIQALLGGVSLAMVLPAIWTIEHVGRRKSLLWGAAAQAVCAIVAGLSGHFTTDNPNASPEVQQRGGNVLIAFAILHVSFYSLFWGPTPWVLLGETFPLRIRSKCIALGAMTNWFWNFMLSYFSPLIADDIGPLILMVFFGCLCFAIGYVYLLIPETKGLALEEVDMLYKSKIPAWRSSTWQPEIKRQAMDKVEGGGGGRRQSESTMVGVGHGVGMDKDRVNKAETGHVEAPSSINNNSNNVVQQQ